MSFVDFAKVKQSVPMEAVVQRLGLNLKREGTDQFRGACPSCRNGGPRALSINYARGFRCFGGSDAKGDQIALVAHIRGMTMKDAAAWLSDGTVPPSHSSPSTSTVPRKGFDATAYLAGLDPAAEQLQPLAISPETITAFRGGYAKGGVNRGKLALAMCDPQGNILGFCGRAIGEPGLTFPSGFDASSAIFGADHVKEGEVRLVRDVLEVLSAAEYGECAVTFLTELVEPQQLEMLAALLDQKKSKLFF